MIEDTRLYLDWLGLECTAVCIPFATAVRTVVWLPEPRKNPASGQNGTIYIYIYISVIFRTFFAADKTEDTKRWTWTATTIWRLLQCFLQFINFCARIYYTTIGSLTDGEYVYVVRMRSPQEQFLRQSEYGMETLFYAAVLSVYDERVSRDISLCWSRGVEVRSREMRTVRKENRTRKLQCARADDQTCVCVCVCVLIDLDRCKVVSLLRNIASYTFRCIAI